MNPDLCSPPFKGSWGALFLFPFLALAQWGSPAIDTVTINGDGKLLSRQALAVDATGAIHAVWTEGDTLQVVFYAFRHTGGEWSAPDTISLPGQHPSNAVIAVIPFVQSPVVCYDSDGQLIIAHRQSGLWFHFTRTLDGYELCCPTIDIDPPAWRHIAVVARNVETDVYNLFYTTDLTETDLIEISNPGIAGFNAKPSIAAYPNGRVDIAYVGGTLEDFRAHRVYNASAGDTNWTDELLATENLFDYSIDVEIGLSNCVNWCISGNHGPWTPDRVFLCRSCTGGCEEVAWALERGASDAIIALDPDEFPHLISSETDSFGSTGTILATDWDWDYWRTERMFGPGASSPNFAIDNQGYGHVLCLQHQLNGDVAVMHLTSEYPIWLDADPVRPPVPANISLNIFPNPFNPTTEITFDLPHSSTVKLAVFDVTGRQVETLLEMPMQAGSHRISFNAFKLAGGIYFCRLVSGEHSLTQKLMLLK